MTLGDAAQDGNLHVLRDRIARGDHVDARDEWKLTPLMRACISGHHTCAQALIVAGAAVDKVDNFGRTALMRTCISGHHKCAQLLIDAGAAMDEEDNLGLTALMWACEGGDLGALTRLKCARVLIDEGAAVDKVDNQGNTALMCACEGGHYGCTRALIDAQADLELTTRDGQNALMIACKSPPSYLSPRKRQGRIRCALALLAATAPIRKADFPDRAVSLKCACGRLQLIDVVLAMKHVIEDAPPIANAGLLTTDAQDIVVNFARDMLARANCQAPSSVPQACCQVLIEEEDAHNRERTSMNT